MKKISTLLFFAVHAIHVISQTCNALDPTFGSGGLRGSLSNNTGLYSKNVLVQPDNKIIQLGNLSMNGASYISAVRFTSDGSLDNSFGQGGKALNSISQYTYISSGALQSDGKILVAGTISNSGFLLTRFSADGVVDNSFGILGTSVIANADYGNFASGLAIQGDGKIVEVGGAILNNDCLANISYCPSHFTMFRFKTNGSLDSSFGQNGRVTTSVGPNRAGYGSSAVIQPDGKIVVAGSYLYDLEPDYYGSYYYALTHFAMVRYLSNGIVDSSFGINGVVTDTSELQGTSAMALQADGKVLVAGYGSHPCQIKRYNIDGTPDSTFGINGQQSNSFNSWASAMLVMPNGKICIAGGTPNNFLIERLNANGSFDTTFNASGKLSIHLGPPGSEDNATGVALQGNHLVVGGNSYFNGTYTQLVLRLLDSIKGLPLVITPRTTLTPCTGNSTKLAVNETGSVQWFMNGSPIVGAIDTVYTTNQNGTYYVTVQNSKGCGQSDPVSVSINGLPVTITPSGSLNFCQGDSVVLTANESGSVQWYKNNIVVPGANGSSYTAKDGGFYFVSVQNAKGCGQSSILVVNVNPVKPPISWNGVNLVTTSSNYSYQWYLNGNSIPGANSYMFTPTQLATYKVIILDYKCNNTSDDFVLDCNTLAVPKPVISWNGSRLSAQYGVFDYQWYLNGDTISGAHDATFQPTQLGRYKVTIGKFGCQNTSDEFDANCNVLGPVVPPNNWDGKKFTTTSGYAHYQWYQNDTAIVGATTNSYTPGDSQFGYYKVVVTDNLGCSSTSNKYPHFVTSVTDIAIGDARLHFYPNPAQSVLNVDIAHIGRNKMEAELYDLSGRLLQRKVLNQVHNQLRVDALSSGVYQLVISNGTEKFAAKIAIIK